MTTAVVVQARWASTRLPGKILRPLGRGTVLSECVRRLQAMRRADLVVLAVPDTAESDPVATYGDELGVRVVRGPEQDVLARFLAAARAVDASTVVRVTSDCPMTDPRLCDAVVEVLSVCGADYACNNDPGCFPHGLDCECFSREILEQAAAVAQDAYDREHVTPWMRRAPGVRRAVLQGPADRMDERWTLDYPEDLAFFQAAWPLLDDGDVTEWRQALARLDAVPDVADINRARRTVRRPPQDLYP